MSIKNLGKISGLVLRLLILYSVLIDIYALDSDKIELQVCSDSVLFPNGEFLVGGDWTTTEKNINFPIKRINNFKCDSQQMANLSLIKEPEGEIKTFTIRSTENGTEILEFDSGFSYTKDESKLQPLINQSVLITSGGFLKIGDTFYHPVDFCINLKTDIMLQVQYCPRKCSKTSPCVRTCCSPDLVMDLNEWKCVPPARKWSPILYKAPHEQVPEEEMALTRIQYYVKKFSCLEKEIWFNRGLNLLVEDTDGEFSEIPHEKIYFRLMEDGGLKQLNLHREWIDYTNEFCVVPVQGFNTTDWEFIKEYDGDEANLMVLSCPIDHIYDNVDTTPIYIISLYICSIFHGLTSIVYFILFDKQNLHGLTVLSLTSSFLIMFILLGTTHLVSRVLKEEDAMTEYATLCFTLAISTHYFYLSTFSWLSIISFDVWMTFRSKVPFNMRSRGLRQYFYYLLFACGLPLIIVCIGITMDRLYPNYESEVLVPDYAKFNCFLSPQAQGAYLYYIITVLLGCNVIWISLTFLTIYQYRKEMANKRKSKKNQNFLLFSKIFVIVGATWPFEFISWRIGVSHGMKIAWYWVILDLVNMLQAFLLFLIFVCNRDKIKLLEQKYPSIQKISRRLTRSRTLQTQTSDAPMPIALIAKP